MGLLGVQIILRSAKVGDRWHDWVGAFPARFNADTIKEGR